MNIKIKATKIELTLQLKDYIEKKMEMLEKYLGNIQVLNADFEVEMTTAHHEKGEIFRAEANLEVKGELLRVEKIESDIYKAIDKVKDHMAEMIIKYKEKRFG